MDLSRMADAYTPFLKELNKQYLNKIFIKQVSLRLSNKGAISYIKQKFDTEKNILNEALGTSLTTLPQGSLSINADGTTEPPIFLQFSDEEDIWYTKHPIKIIKGKIQIDQETVSKQPSGIVISNPTTPLPKQTAPQYRGNSGASVSGANPPVQQAGPNSKYTLQSGQPVTAAEFNTARIQTAARTRQGSQATAEIYRKVLADPLPWEPNQWIELGEEVRMANGELILKDGNPLIEFWYINPTTKKSEYTLPEGGVIRDLAVSSSIGQELEKLRNRLSARETTAMQDATLTMATNINSAQTLEAAKAVAREGVQQSFIPKYSTHPQIKEAYEQLAKPVGAVVGEKYFKMKKMGVPVPAILIKVNADTELTSQEKTTIVTTLQAGGQRGGLPPAPGGLGAALAGKLSMGPGGPRSGGPGGSGPPGSGPGASPQATKLNEVGMEQLKDLVQQIKANPAYDTINTESPHELFICTNGSCSVKPKYKDSVLETVVAKAKGPTCAVSAPSAGTNKLIVDDFIAMKDIMDRASLIAFMKSTYAQDEKQFNIDIQLVFPDINGDEITKAVTQYEAKQKQTTPTAAPVQVNSPEERKRKAAEALAKAVSGRKESGNAVTPYEEYTEMEMSMLKQIDALNSKENADSIPKLTEQLATHKKSLQAAIQEGRIKGFHVKQLLTTEKQLKEQQAKLDTILKTPGFKEKVAFMKDKALLIITTPNGRKLTIDPKKRTVTGGTRGRRQYIKKHRRTHKQKYRR